MVGFKQRMFSRGRNYRFRTALDGTLARCNMIQVKIIAPWIGLMCQGFGSRGTHSGADLEEPVGSPHRISSGRMASSGRDPILEKNLFLTAKSISEVNLRKLRIYRVQPV